MNFPISYFIILLISALILFSIFYIFYKMNFKKFIGNMNLNMYLFSMILCIIGFIIIIIFLLLNNNLTKDQIRINFISILVIIYSTILWIICSFYNKIYLSIFFLILLCIGNITLLYIINNIKHDNLSSLKILSLFSTSYILFHHLIIDLFLWTYYKYIK